jgi:hypothetical protein
LELLEITLHQETQCVPGKSMECGLQTEQAMRFLHGNQQGLMWLGTQNSGIETSRGWIAIEYTFTMNVGSLLAAAKALLQIACDAGRYYHFQEIAIRLSMRSSS